MIWLICGGRNFADTTTRTKKAMEEYAFVHATLQKYAERLSVHYSPDDNWLPFDIKVIAGGARGVDSAAIDWAMINWLDFKEYPADWETYGKKAGFIRNKQMLLEECPDLVIAFPGGKGTASMVRLARDAGVETHEIQY